MAVVAGTVQAAWGFQQPLGPAPTHTITATEYAVEMCFVSVKFDVGTYAQADGFSVDPRAIIQAARRSGKSITHLLGACCVGAGLENGAHCISGNCTALGLDAFTGHLYKEDLSTEHDNAALSATWNRPVVFAVFYYELA